jgi:hypothetical protein
LIIRPVHRSRCSKSNSVSPLNPGAIDLLADRFEFDLHANELGPGGVVVLVEPVGEHQPQGVVVRVRPDRS